jgi:hypothetical protein
MGPELPPPDPNEPHALTPDSELNISGPTAIFVGGRPSEGDDRLADAILAFRPGVLVVLKT